MRRLLHDFYIPACLDIFKNVVPAMGSDSRLINCDMLLPERVEVGRPKELYRLDFSLITISGREKTFKEFTDMFDEVGLGLVKIYPSAVGKTAMLETRLKEAGRTLKANIIQQRDSVASSWYVKTEHRTSH
ncbi:hypothetical protein BDZ45DRAFT_368074 [Acephala macrosclerotiorum]|nr:hypothetical protein BDZ45DRAFT_368074 [Acephala macrosclerotiorum]